MKHLVRIQFTPEAGREVESRPGRPATVIQRFAERFAPEALYMSPSRREIFMVCELEAADMAELMIAASDFAGQHPTFVPVVEGKEFAAIAGKVVPAARALTQI